MSKPLKVAEVAERLGVSESLIYEWCDEKPPRIPHVRWGRRHKRGSIRIYEEDLEKFVEQSKVK